MEKKINFNINDGNEFFAHEVSINFNPTQFVLDFKCITPRIDPRNQNGPNISLKHNTVMLDAYHAKKFHELMAGVISKYEAEFGEIEKPKAIALAEKKRPKEAKVEKTNLPNYFG